MMTSTATENQRKGYSFAFLSCLFAGLYVVLAKWTQAELPTISLLALIQFFAALMLSSLLFLKDGRGKLRRVEKNGWVSLAALSLLYFFAYWTLFAAIDRLAGAGRGGSRDLRVLDDAISLEEADDIAKTFAMHEVKDLLYDINNLRVFGALHRLPIRRIVDCRFKNVSVAASLYYNSSKRGI